MADEITETATEDETSEEQVDELAGLRSALAKERTASKTLAKEAKRAQVLEAELAKVREANQTEGEKAITKAREEAAAQARGEVLSTVGQRLVKAEFKAEAAGKVKDLDGLLEDLNLAKFVDADGEPDSKAIKAAVARYAKAAPAETTPPFNGGPRKTAATTDMNQLIRDRAGLS
jgi:hypothetical protein